MKNTLFASPDPQHTVDTLIEARDMIFDPSNWIRFFRSNDDHTRHCATGAVRCSIHGHISQTTGAPQKDHILHSKVMKLLHRSTRYLGHESTTTLNDLAGHDTVMEMFDVAIRLAKDEETT